MSTEKVTWWKFRSLSHLQGSQRRSHPWCNLVSWTSSNLSKLYRWISWANLCRLKYSLNQMLDNSSKTFLLASKIKCSMILTHNKHLSQLKSRTICQEKAKVSTMKRIPLLTMSKVCLTNEQFFVHIYDLKLPITIIKLQTRLLVTVREYLWCQNVQ